MEEKKEDFKEVFEKMCREELDQACLFALSKVALRFTSEENMNFYSDIKEVLNGINTDVTEINKLKEIINIVDSYDAKLMEHLSSVEEMITVYLRRAKNGEQQTPCCQPKREVSKVENQRKKIKKWWE